MNEHEIARIAAAANALRPDWPTASLQTLLAKPELVHRPRRDVAVALAWIACEADTKTPARVLSAGPWWQAAGVETNPADKPVPRPPPPGSPEECRDHPGEWRINCRPHNAERKAYHEEITATAQLAARLTRDQAIAAAREGIRQHTASEES